MLDDKFLNDNKAKAVTVFLTNGVKLQGTIAEVDEFSFTLKRDNVGQLVYKHAVATVMPPQFSKYPQ